MVTFTMTITPEQGCNEGTNPAYKRQYKLKPKVPSPGLWRYISSLCSTAEWPFPIIPDLESTPIMLSGLRRTATATSSLIISGGRLYALTDGVPQF